MPDEPQSSFLDNLGGWTPDDPPPSHKLTIQERFTRYHQANPGVYEKLVGLAREVKGAGRSTYGIASLFERLRWHYHIEQKLGDEAFKLSNDYRSRYARLIMSQETDLADFFNLRELRAE